MTEKKQKQKKTAKIHYVDNQKFLEEMSFEKYADFIINTPLLFILNNSKLIRSSSQDTFFP